MNLTIGELKTCFSAKPVDVSHADVLKHWLRGTTCSGKPRDVREIVAETDSLILLKHRSHAEYCGCMCGSTNCCVYVVLYSKQRFIEPAKDNWCGVNYGAGYIRKWEGQGNCNVNAILRSLDRDGIYMRRVKE